MDELGEGDVTGAGARGHDGHEVREPARGPGGGATADEGHAAGGHALGEPDAAGDAPGRDGDPPGREPGLGAAGVPPGTGHVVGGAEASGAGGAPGPAQAADGAGTVDAGSSGDGDPGNDAGEAPGPVTTRAGASAGGAEAHAHEGGAAPTSASPGPTGALARARAALRGLWVALTGAFGVTFGLALVSIVPVLQLATLGWLLEVEGRLGRGAAWRDAFPGFRAAGRVGAALLAAAVATVPWLVVEHAARDAALLDPGSDVARRLDLAAAIVGWGTLAHVLGALARGARLRDFACPWAVVSAAAWALRGGPRALPAQVRAAWAALAPGHYVGLGARGLLAGFLWLLPAAALLAAVERRPELIVLGGPLLVLTLPWVVVAQAQLAATGRFRDAFDLGALRALRRRAPLAFAVATATALGLALPLYLLEIEPLPRDARWLPALPMIAAAVPGRALSGWARRRGAREGRAHWTLRLLGAALVLAAAAAYAFVLFFAQLFTWNGPRALFAQHALLLPVTFP